MLFETLKTVAKFAVEPKLIAVIAPCPVILVIVLLLILDVVPPKYVKVIPVIAEVPPVQLFKTLPV